MTVLLGGDFNYNIVRDLIYDVRKYGYTVWPYQAHKRRKKNKIDFILSYPTLADYEKEVNVLLDGTDPYECYDHDPLFALLTEQPAQSAEENVTEPNKKQQDSTNSQTDEMTQSMAKMKLNKPPETSTETTKFDDQIIYTTFTTMTWTSDEKLTSDEKCVSVPITADHTITFLFPSGCVEQMAKLAFEVTYTNFWNETNTATAVFWGPIIKVIQEPEYIEFLKPFTITIPRPSVMENATTDVLEQRVFFGVDGREWTDITEGLDMTVTDTHISFKTTCFTGYTIAEYAGKLWSYLSKLLNEQHLDQTIVTLLITNGHSDKSLFFDCWPQEADEIRQLEQRALNKDLFIIMEKILLATGLHVVAKTGQNLCIDSEYAPNVFTFPNPPGNESHQEYCLSTKDKSSATSLVYYFVKPDGSLIEDADKPIRHIPLDLQKIYAKFPDGLVCSYQYKRKTESQSTMVESQSPPDTTQLPTIDHQLLLQLAKHLPTEVELFELGLALNLEDVEIQGIRTDNTSIIMAVYRVLQTWVKRFEGGDIEKRQKLINVLEDMQRNDIIVAMHLK